MQHEQLLGNARWDILAALAKGPGTATEIAAAAKTSLPNASQQLKLLEAYGYAKGKKEPRDGPGKPRIAFSLAREFAHVAVVRRGFAAKKALPMDESRTAMLNIWFLDRQEDQHTLSKLYWQHEELFRRAQGVAVVETKEQELHLLILVEPSLLEEYRKEYSKLAVTGSDGKKRTVISWTHAAGEIEEGIGKRDQYYVNLVRKLHVVVEREDAFAPFR